MVKATAAAAAEAASQPERTRMVSTTAVAPTAPKLAATTEPWLSRGIL
jgi:hypothetical protein